DKDVITPEHALELHRQIPDSELAIIPGGHGQYIGEITTITPDFRESDLVVPMIERFDEISTSVFSMVLYTLMSKKSLNRLIGFGILIFLIGFAVGLSWIDYLRWLMPVGSIMTFT